MKKISKAASLLLNDPVSLLKIGYAQAMRKVGHTPEAPVIKERNGVKFEFDFDYGPQIKIMYFDAYEPLTIRAMRKFLKTGDTFIDAGANIGFISWVAAGIVGKEGQVHSFEPSSRDFDRLSKLPAQNPGHKIICHRMALGEKKEIKDMDIAKSTWVGWNTLVPTFMRKNDFQETIQVQVVRLDDYIRENEKSLGRIAMIKIDTEGFEFFVLKGLQHFFENTAIRPAILCEVTPRANGLMGIRMPELWDYLSRYGYQCYSLCNYRQKIDLANLTEQSDVLFLAG